MNGVLAIDPSAPAVEAGGQWRTFGEISARVEGLDRALNGLGLGAESRVAVFMSNRFEAFAALCALQATDRCLVIVNPAYPDATISADLMELKAPVVVAEAAQWDRPGVREAVRAIGAAGIVMGGQGAPVAFVEGLDKVVGPELKRRAPGVVIEMLTSGTTGKPKRIPLSRDSFQHSIGSTVEAGQEPGAAPRLRKGVQILPAPLSHISGISRALTAIASGRQNCLIERFNVPEWRDAVVRYRPKMASVPPTGLRMILEANVPKEDLASLTGIASGTAPVDDALIQAFLDRYDLPVLANYGATEFSGGVANWSLADFRAHYARKRGSVGRLQRGAEGRVVDPDTGAPLPFGEVGVLELRSKQLADPDSWLRTTDLAVLDDENFLWIKGRADSAIIRGGFKVHPEDIVKALEAHPAVREAAVVGIRDQRLGEAPAAAIILAAGQSAPPEDELVAFLRTRLTAYQVPVRFRYVDDFPRTSSMKPAIPALRDLLSEPDRQVNGALDRPA